MTSRITQQLKELGRAGLDKLVSSFDSWSNDVTGFGTSDDKTTYTRFMGGQLLTLQELSNIYHGDDLGARMVDVVPDEMLREGFTLELGDAGLNQAVNDKLEGLGIDEHFANGIRWGRLYGEGAILIGADDGRSPDQPLVAERARDIGYLYVMDGRYYWPRSYYREAGHPKLGQPETYAVQPPAYAGQPSAVVHESRLIRFGGSPTGAQEREINLSRDYSVLQRAYEALRAFNTGWKAVEILLTDGHQSVFKMQGLAEMIGSGGEALAAARLKVINLYRSVLRAIVVDAGDKEGGIGAEDFTRNSVSFSDIPNTLDKFMLRLAAAVQIPVTILMGQSPAGMNATGESDFRWFYDRIRSEQTRKLAPKIRRLTQVLLATKNWKPQKAPKALVVNFPLLWTETPSQAAQTRSALITGDAALVTAQIALPEEIALQRLKPGGYAQELVLTPEGVKVRTAALSAELTAILPDDTKADIPNIELAPTDAAAVLKVNEARASMNLPPLDGPDGELTLSEFAAKSAPAPGGGFGGPPGVPPSAAPKPLATKPPGGGAPPPFAKAGEGEETKTDADEYERDEAGRFAETGGAGGASGGASGGSSGSRAPGRVAKAHDRLAKAQADHAAAKAAHESSKATLEAAKAEGHAQLDRRLARRQEAAQRAGDLAKEASKELEKNKAEIKAIEREQASMTRGLSEEEELEALGSDRYEVLDRKIGDLDSRNDDLKEHVRALKAEQKKNAKESPRHAQMREAIDKADARTVEKLEDHSDLGSSVDAQVEYLRDRELSERYGSPEKASSDAYVEKGIEIRERLDPGSASDIGTDAGMAAYEASLFPDFSSTDYAQTAAKLARTERAVRVHERELARVSRASKTKTDAGDDYERDDAGRFAGSGGSGGSSGGGGPSGGSGGAAKATVRGRETAFHAANEAKRAEAAHQISALEKALPGAAAAKKEALAAHKADLKAAGLRSAPPELDRLTNARLALETAERNSGGNGTDAFTSKEVDARRERLAEAERAAAPLFERMPTGAAERHELSAKRDLEYDDVKAELGYFKSQARDCETRERAASDLKRALQSGDAKAARGAQEKIDRANENSDEPALMALGSSDNGLDVREYLRSVDDE
jgi:phage-related protein (TIGR01555 family)